MSNTKTAKSTETNAPRSANTPSSTGASNTAKPTVTDASCKSSSAPAIVQRSDSTSGSDSPTTRVHPSSGGKTVLKHLEQKATVMHCNNITGDSATVSEVIDKVRSNTSVLEKHYPGNTRIVIAYIEKNIYLGMNAQEKSNCHRPKLSMYNKTRDKRLAYLGVMVIPVCRLDMTVKKTRRTFSREVTPNVVSKERKLTVITETGVPERSCAKCHFVRPIYSGCSLCASVLCFVCYKNQCKTDTSKFKDTDANVHCLNCDKGKHYTTYDKGLAVILYDTTKDPNDVVKSLSYEEHFDSIDVDYGMPFKTCKGVANASSSTKVRSPVAVKCPRGSSPSPSSSSSSSPPTSGSDCDSSDSDSDSESDESDQEQESPHESSNVKKKEEEVKSDEESDEDEKDEDYKEEEGDSKEEKVSKESRKRKPLTEVVDLRKNLKSMRTDLTRMRRDRNAMYGQLIEIKNLVSNSNSGSTPSITRKEPEVYSGKSCVLCGIKVKFDGVDLNKEIKVVCPECVSYINTKKPRTDGTYNILLFP